MRLRGIAFVALGLASGFVLAGVWVTAPFAAEPKAPPGALTKAIKKTEVEATGRVHWTLSVTGGGHSAVLFSSGSTFDNAHRLLDFTLDLRNFVAQEPPSQRVGKLADWRFEIIFDSSRTLVMYMSSPLFRESSFLNKLPPKARQRPWMKLDLASVLHGHSSQLGPGVTNQISAMLPGPGSPVAFVGALSEPARRDGSEQVDGVHTTRYRTTIDLARQTGLVPSTFAKLTKLTGPRFQAEVWADDGSLIRRVRFTSSPIRSQGNAQIVMTYDLSDLGTNVHLSVPPAKQVFDGAKLGP
jgi:hypothetical protein